LVIDVITSLGEDIVAPLVELRSRPGCSGQAHDRAVAVFDGLDQATLREKLNRMLEEPCDCATREDIAILLEASLTLSGPRGQAEPARRDDGQPDLAALVQLGVPPELVEAQAAPTVDVSLSGDPRVTRLGERWASHYELDPAGLHELEADTTAAIDRLATDEELRGLVVMLEWPLPRPLKDRLVGARFLLDFVTTQAEAEERLVALEPFIGEKTIAWLAYPKGSKAAGRDLNRDTIWAFARTIGLTLVTNIAVDETWSALRIRRAPA
jgi:hypothetical protein